MAVSDVLPPAAARGEREAGEFAPTVTVVAPARLHLGFVDLHGGLGRRFGSLGLALGGVQTRLVARRSTAPAAFGGDAERLGAHLRRVLAQLGVENGVHLELEQAIPAHAGLGSGTQLALAVATAVAELFGRELTPREAAGWMERGLRSGIGLATFELGGFVLDGGRGPDTELPPLLARLDFPNAWRVLLVTDSAHEGLSGAAERSAFAQLPPMSEAASGALARCVLMQVLPALAEADFASFCAGIAEVQARVGDYFAPCQGGRFTSPDVAEVMQWLAGQGVRGYGQSSWGPTGFAFLPGEAEAEALRRRALERFGERQSLGIVVCRGRNRGADVSVVREAVAG